MKNLLFTLLFILPTFVNAQETKQTEINQYLRKANNKRKTGNVLLITGSGLFLTGFVIASTGKNDKSWFISERELAGASLSSLGIISALTSVPFYISAHHNRKKSLNVSPTTGIIRSNSINERRNYASVGIDINF